MPCSLCSNVTEVKIESKPKDIHLSASIESFVYENKTEDDKFKMINPITPISNRATGWEHPELDFYNSSEMASKSNEKDIDSFANS